MLLSNFSLSLRNRDACHQSITGKQKRHDDRTCKLLHRAKAHGDDSDPFKGLYISDEDADLLLEERIPQGHNFFMSSSKAVEIQADEACATFSLSDVEIDGVNLPGCGTRSEILEVHTNHQDSTTVKLPKKPLSFEPLLGS